MAIPSSVVRAVGMGKKVIKSYVYLKDWNPAIWEWWCYPFLNVKMSGICRTIKRLGFEPDVVSLKLDDMTHRGR